jgi:low affinity Fe/Cu permease
MEGSSNISMVEKQRVEKQKVDIGKRFSSFAGVSAGLVGSPWAFLFALVTIFLWAATGPIFHFSDTWQLIINS